MICDENKPHEECVVEPLANTTVSAEAVVDASPVVAHDEEIATTDCVPAVPAANHVDVTDQGATFAMPRSPEREDEPRRDGGERKRFDDTNKVFVKNMNPNTTEGEVRDFFSRCGEIVDLNVRNTHNGSWAFVGFSCRSDYEEALQLNGKEVLGSVIEVVPKSDRYQREREQRRPRSRSPRRRDDRRSGYGDRRGGYGDRRDERRDERRCFKCGGTGHISISCPQSDVKCFKCGENGHISTVCPNMNNRDRNGGGPPSHGGNFPNRSPRRYRSPRRDYNDYRRRDGSREKRHRREDSRDLYGRRSRSPRRDRY